MDNWFGYALVVLAAAIFGASSVVIKYTYSTGLSPIPVLIIQSLASSALAWLWVWYSKKDAVIPVSARLAMVAQGVVGCFLTSVLFYSALGMLGAALSTLLLFTFPAFVVVYEVLFNKYRITNYEKIALMMAFAGLILSIDIFSASPGTVVPWAILVGLCSAVTYAFQNVNGERLLLVTSTPVVTAWALTFSTLTLLLVYRPVWLLDLSLSGLQIALLLTGAVLYLLPLMLYLAGIGRIGAGIASIISTAEIPFTLVLAWLFLQETLSGLQVLGGVLITVSIAVLYYHRIE